jgi:hypothetical protein
MNVLLAIDPAVELAARNAKAAYWAAIFAWSHAAWFALFGLAAAVLLLHVFLPRDPATQVLRGGVFQNIWHALGRRRQRLGVGALAVLLLLLAVTQQRAIDDRRGFIADQEKRCEKALKSLAAGQDTESALRAQYLYMPEGDSLAYMSLGNTGLAADYVWLTSMQYVSSSFRRGHKFEMLSRFYNTMLELDPHWTEAAVNAGKILSALELDRYKVEKFYINALTNNPDSLKILEEGGKLFVVPPLDPDLQGEYSKHAVDWFSRLQTKLLAKPQTEQVKRDLITVNDLIARLGMEAGAGYYLVADEMLLKNATDPASPEATRSISARDWLNARSYVITNTLEKMLRDHKKIQGAFPPTLEPIFARLPNNGKSFREDAFGFPVQYNPDDGDVRSVGVNARRALQASSVIAGLINLFQGTNNRLPKDLDELTSFVRFHYKNPATPPSAMVYESIGRNFDCAIGPLGRWDYDPATGKIKLPPECDVNTLYRKAADVLRMSPAGVFQKS